MKRIVQTGPELVQALKDTANLPISEISIENASTDTLIIDEPVVLPATIRAKSKRILIRGNGHTIMPSRAMEFVIGRSQPVSAQEADNVFQSQGFRIENMFIDCKSLAGTGILSRSTFHDRIENVCVISPIFDGIALEFCMNAYISQCEVRNAPRYGFSIRSGTYTGAGVNNSGSNQTLVEQCRVFPRENMESCFYTENTGVVDFKKCIVDFNSSGIPKRGFHVNFQSSTTSKLVTIESPWLESETKMNMFEFNMNGGVARIITPYAQKTGVLVNAYGGGYAELRLECLPWLLSSTKFKTIANGILWKVISPNTSFNFSDPLNWIDGIVPTRLSIDGFITNSKGQAMNGSHLQINGSRVVTEGMLNTTLAGYVRKP